MFKGVLTIVTIAGVPVRVHWTFLILLAWVFGAAYMRQGSVAEGLVSIAFVGAIFVCVVAHEFGHILTARAFGVKTRDVTLLPIGGVAALERIPEKPWQELLVAIAGPLVNVAIAMILLPIVAWRFDPNEFMGLESPLATSRGFFVSVAMINIWLVLFNLIPAFPMDGGRVLRSILAMFTDRLSATRAAAIVGQVIAVGMALVGIFGGLPLLLLVAFFVFLGAGAESAGTQAQEMLRGLRVDDVMVREFRILGEHDPLSTAVDELLANAQSDFPVTPDGAASSPVVGLLTRADLVRALSQQGSAAPIGGAMRPACDPLGPRDTAQHALRQLREGQCPIIPVIEGGSLIGLLTAENISEAIMVRAALTRHVGAPEAPATGSPSPSA